MKILIANPGSTSYKCKLYETEEMKVLFKASIERIGDAESIISFNFESKDKEVQKKKIADYYSAVNLTLEIIKQKYKIEELSAVGFKTVHAKGISECTELTNEVILAMKEYRLLAPVHTDVYLNTISIFQKILASVPLIGLFETHFHKNIPPEAYMYGIPYKYYEDYGIRKYGFHGSSHMYIGMRAKKLFNADKVISCHLGGSSSVCAVKDSCSIDTSMGMSPQSGLLNAKRVGDLDSFALLYLMEKENLSVEEASDILISKSGVFGISGISGDFRDIKKQMLNGNKKAELAFKTFAYYVKRYIGEYLAILNNADCIVFTAGAGQNSPRLRKQIINGMENLGIILDEEKNNLNPSEGLISDEYSKIDIAVIPTDEEYIVVFEVMKYLERIK